MSLTPAQTPFPESYLDAQKAIDTEITQLTARIISLKSARNALAPVSRLHSEVLQEIFFLVHDGSWPKGNGTILVTSISRAWRELAHHTSNLWTYIDLRHPGWIQTAVSRSKDCYLEVDLDWESRAHIHSISSTVPLCLANLSRIKTLSFNARSINPSSFPKNVAEWTIPAPLMEELNLLSISLPPNLFSGSCPSLQSLDLYYCHVDWDTFPVFPNLKGLRVSHPRTRATINHVVRLIRAAEQSLEKLEFTSVLAIGNVEAVHRNQLNNLNSLSITDESLDVITALLDRISFRHHVSTRLGIPQWGDGIVAGAFLLSRNISQWEIDCLHITSDDDDDSVIICITETQLNGNLIRNTDGIDEDTHSVSPGTTSQCFQTSFFIDQGEDFMWFEYFATLGTLRELSVDPSAILDLTHILQQQNVQLHTALEGEGELDDDLNQEKVALGRAIMLLHPLQVLKIHGGTYPVYHLRNEDVLVLRNWLIWRKKLGLRLARFVVSGMVISSGDWLRAVFEEAADEFELTHTKEKPLHSEFLPTVESDEEESEEE